MEPEKKPSGESAYHLTPSQDQKSDWKKPKNDFKIPKNDLLSPREPLGLTEYLEIMDSVDPIKHSLQNEDLFAL